MKIRHLLAPLVILTLVLSGCNNYNKLTYSSKQAFKKKEVAQNIEEHDVYVHDNENTYRLNDPKFKEEKLTGTPVKVEESATPEISEEDAKNDIHLYLDNENLLDNLESSPQEFGSEDFQSVEISEKSDADTRVVLIVLLVVGIVLILALLILLILVNAASDGSSSGTSDSGGSDSGCYVATLAYGDYDAPQVLVLRKFRDQFLKKSRAGRSFISWYYAHSPAFVERYRSQLWFHKIMRGGLNVFVGMLRPFYGK
ncbi:MAG: hypothetical protein ACI837_000629 [Crocinitomicaceae bacterium]|jgi:hypothetical protein